MSECPKTELPHTKRLVKGEGFIREKNVKFTQMKNK